MTELIELFRALGSERRFKIFLHLQENKEATVCDIAKLLDVSEPAACFHLKKLLRVGIIQQRRDGKFTISSSKDAVQSDRRSIECLGE